MVNIPVWLGLEAGVMEFPSFIAPKCQALRATLRFTGHERHPKSAGITSHFTIDFSTVIQISQTTCSALIQIIEDWSLQNFAHATTAVLSWHVQKFVASWQLN